MAGKGIEVSYPYVAKNNREMDFPVTITSIMRVMRVSAHIGIGFRADKS